MAVFKGTGGAIQLANNHLASFRSKRIHVTYHFNRHEIREGSSAMAHIK